MWFRTRCLDFLSFGIFLIYINWNYSYLTRRIVGKTEFNEVMYAWCSAQDLAHSQHSDFGRNYYIMVCIAPNSRLLNMKNNFFLLTSLLIVMPTVMLCIKMCAYLRPTFYWLLAINFIMNNTERESLQPHVKASCSRGWPESSGHLLPCWILGVPHLTWKEGA